MGESQDKAGKGTGVRLTPPEYITPIYQSWDRRGLTPPSGYSTWMDYLPTVVGLLTTQKEDVHD